MGGTNAGGPLLRSSAMTMLSGWGRFPQVEADERLSERLEPASRDAVLARGLGRAYGDAALPARPGETVLGTRLADRLLGFDPEGGVLRAEAGLSLGALHETFLPRSLASPVIPGTRHVTLGGMVAADVHGKNHHVAGCFGEHVRALRMRVADGRVLEVTETSEPELFRATLGGMGLTGHILEVELALERVPSPWIASQGERVIGLDALVRRLREASRAFPFSVAWYDSTCLRPERVRGIVSWGRWARRSEAPAAPPHPPRIRLGVPVELPASLVTHSTVRAFNALWARLGRTRRAVASPYAFFHPLDGVAHWNRLYGPRGFAQYQCVLPEPALPGALHALMTTFARRAGASPVTVLKDCGPEGRGMLSFPRPGMSVALDLPLRGRRGDETRALVDALNEIVVAAGGRIYLAKDALTRREHFAAMEPRLATWRAVRRTWDPEGRLQSALGARLLDEAAPGRAAPGGEREAVA